MQYQVRSLSQEVETLKNILNQREHEITQYESDRKNLMLKLHELDKKRKRLKKEVVKLRSREIM